MEQELLPYLDSKGHLSVLQRNKYLESKRACRLNALGHIETILYEGDYQNMTFKYQTLNKEIDQALKNIKHKSIGKARTDFIQEVDKKIEQTGDLKEVIIDKHILENAEYDHNKNEITADEIPF